MVTDDAMETIKLIMIMCYNDTHLISRIRGGDWQVHCSLTVWGHLFCMSML